MKENEKYVGCIELDALGKQMRQAKAKFNNVLKEKKAEALKKATLKDSLESQVYEAQEKISKGLEVEKEVKVVRKKKTASSSSKKTEVGKTTKASKTKTKK